MKILIFTDYPKICDFSILISKISISDFSDFFFWYENHKYILKFWKFQFHPKIISEIIVISQVYLYSMFSILYSLTILYFS